MTDYKKPTTVFIALAISLVALVPSVSAAAPTYGNAYDVNGDYSEWKLADDYFADMYRAGDPTKVMESKLYLHYDCTNKVMCALVLENSPAQALVLPDDAFNAIDTKKTRLFQGQVATMESRRISDGLKTMTVV